MRNLTYIIWVICFITACLPKQAIIDQEVLNKKRATVSLLYPPGYRSYCQAVATGEQEITVLKHCVKRNNEPLIKNIQFITFENWLYNVGEMKDAIFIKCFEDKSTGESSDAICKYKTDYKFNIYYEVTNESKCEWATVILDEYVDSLVKVSKTKDYYVLDGNYRHGQSGSPVFCNNQLVAMLAFNDGFSLMVE